MFVLLNKLIGSCSREQDISGSPIRSSLGGRSGLIQRSARSVASMVLCSDSRGTSSATAAPEPNPKGMCARKRNRAALQIHTFRTRLDQPVGVDPPQKTAAGAGRQLAIAIQFGDARGTGYHAPPVVPERAVLNIEFAVENDGEDLASSPSASRFAKDRHRGGGASIRSRRRGRCSCSRRSSEERRAFCRPWRRGR